MKILFLSFEGVLRSEASFIKKKKARCLDPDGLCEEALFLLANLLLTTPNIYLVLTGPEKSLSSSDLRILLALNDTICEKLITSSDNKTLTKKALTHLVYERVIDSTPTLRNQTPGEEIRRYIMHSSRRISSYLVLDSESDLSAIKDDFCILTDPSVGLTELEVKKIKKRLGVKNESVCGPRRSKC